MNTIEINNIKRLTPSNWNELTRKQLLFVARMFYIQKLDDRKTKDLLIIVFLNIKWRVLQHINISQLKALNKTVNFLLEDITLTKNIIPSFRQWFKKYHGPKDALTNITINEYAYADTYYINYRSSENINYLNKLIAVLYRTENKLVKSTDVDYNDDIRHRFNPAFIEKYEKKFAKLKPELKYAILMYYEGCRKHLKKRFSGVFSTAKQTASKKIGWGDIIIELSGNKFGTYQQTCDALLYPVLTHLQHLDDKRIEHEKQIAELKNK